MKRIILLALVALVISAGTASASGLPLNIAGIKLGDDISKYAPLCDMKAAGTLQDAPFLDETSILPGAIPGVRGGSIDYGNCLNKGKILRIKLKFTDMSKGFYKKLYKAYEDKFGEPDKWLGDPFHNVIAWLWTIKDGGMQMDLVVQYSVDPENKPGVSVKMSYRTLMDQEYGCYRSSQGKKKRGATKAADVTPFIPR